MLLERDISEFDPEKFPDEHELKLSAKLQSLEPHERFIAEFIADMKFPSDVMTESLSTMLIIRPGLPGEGLASTDEEWETKGINLEKEGIYELYLRYLRAHLLGRAVPRNVFFKSLWKMTGPAGRSIRPQDSKHEQRPRVIALSERPVCRRELETYLAVGTTTV
jgi:hypothetical protein